MIDDVTKIVFLQCSLYSANVALENGGGETPHSIPVERCCSVYGAATPPMHGRT